MNIKKDLALRRWATSHGGVYVPVDANTQPNPYLLDPLRDIEGPAGTKLTLMNPAFVLRQIQQMFGQDIGVSGHITSLKPLNPANAPDAWERKALEAIAGGVSEVAESTEIDGKPTVRVIHALKTEKGCLKCHEWQGYKEGDIRGGISAAVDMQPILAYLQRGQTVLFASHGGVWLIGIFVILFLDHRGRRLQADRRSEDERRRLTANVFESAHEGIMITDRQCAILEVNHSFTEMTGYPREALIGHTPHLLASGRHDPDFYRSMWGEIGLRGFWRGEIWNRRKNGEVYPCLLTISAVTDPNEKVSHYVGTFSDITQVKAQQAHLELLAHYDPLTRLPNRVLLADRLSQAMAQAKRSNSLLAIGFLDLDGFKAVNDSLGHALGDRLLIEVSERLRAFLRGGDTIARMGGDEFVLVLSGLDSLQECDRAINRLLLAIAAPYTIQDDPIQLSASMGVTLYPNDGSDPDTLIRHADQAMYIAKQAGRNRYHLFDAEQDRQAHAQHEALGRLQQALDNQEFCLYYQPKVDMRSGLVYGAEALIRWNHPQQGLLAPGEFLPVIEGSHLAVPLGEWVIGAALKQLAVWHASGLKLSVSVNIAASHLQCGDFTERLRHSLASVAPELAQHLECEVLETAALENISGVAQIIKECSDLGVDFSLDDFGTGYSSLSYLKRLPAKTLKIDQSFVRTMLVDLEDLAIVEGVVGLTHIFHRQVVAEGVESAEHGIVLLQIGCDRAQGYGIARPMPADKIPDWVLSWRPDPRWSKPEALRLKREDFPLLAMETEHRAWVDRLIAFIEAEEGSQPPPPLSSRDCAFGRWYDGPGLLKYGPIDEFTALRDVHEQIHDFALDLINLAKSQGRRQARQGFPQLLALRDGLLARFETLKEAVAARSQE